MTRSANGPARIVGALVGATILLAVGLQWLAVGQDSPPKGCPGCHRAVSGIEPAHQTVGCTGCHLGNTGTDDQVKAHEGLVRMPGQFGDLDTTCGTPLCHAAMATRLRANVMTTMSGVINVDRWVFEEASTKSGYATVESLGHSPADSHLRNLCASCHLGAPKAEPGPVTERTRGGGCLACHLAYDEGARDDLLRRSTTPADGGPRSIPRLAHPRLTSLVPDEACFGCHSRSGRVSLNYQGWHEGEPGDGGASRVLEDGRRVWRAEADVHAEGGLGCTDCHGSWEVMGDGRAGSHREDQAAVACADCHVESEAPSVSLERLDPESSRIARREGLAQPGRRFVVTHRSAFPLVGASPGPDGGVQVSGRFSRRTVMARAPARTCSRDGAHRRVSCPACHEAWVPRCVSCHTGFDPSGVMYDLLDRREAPGEWLETSGPSLIGPPALGARVSDGGVVAFEGFTPGMILSLSIDGGAPRFHRLFAPIFAHTIRRSARPCEACHREPFALGYGSGHLSFSVVGRRTKVTFSPALPAGPDGLPEDAWVGFLKQRGSESTTRDDTRPLSPAEQQRVLTVGACLGCHPRADPMWPRALAGAGLPPTSPRCRAPFGHQ